MTSRERQQPSMNGQETSSTGHAWTLRLGGERNGVFRLEWEVGLGWNGRWGWRELKLFFVALREQSTVGPPSSL